MKAESSKTLRVYRERDHVLALAATMAQRAGYVAWVGKANAPSRNFQYVVYIELPEGQVSWHIRNDELPLFSALPQDVGVWDAKKRVDKYVRIAEFCTGSHVVLSQLVPRKDSKQ